MQSEIPLRQFRDAAITGSVRADKTARTASLAFSSEMPYERYWGIEILDHSPGAVRLSRVNDGGPVLVDHDTRDHVGTIESVELGADRVARANVRFGNSVRANEIFQDVQDGIRKHVSVAYTIHAMTLQESEGNLDTYLVTDWEPYEISLVAVPADPSVGVGRSHSLKGNKMEQENETVTRSQVRGARSADNERGRASEIFAIARQFKAEEMVPKALAEGTTVDQFSRMVLERIEPSKSLNFCENTELGLSQKELQRYSFLRAIRAQLPDADIRMKQAAAFEIECSTQLQKQLGRQARGLTVPNEVLNYAMRDLSSGISTAGGHTVQTDILSGRFIDVLRNKSMAIQAGATVLPELRGNIAIPRKTAGVTATWVAEGSAGTESTATFDQVTMSPKSITGFTDFTRRLILQSSLDVEAMVRADLAAAVALGIDLGALNGSGASNQPTGILNTAGIGSVAGGTNGLAPTWDHMVDLQSAVANANSDQGSVGYMTNTKVRGKLKKTQKFTGTNGDAVWGDGDSVGGVKAFVSNQMPSNLTKGSSSGVCSAILYGAWADLFIGLWGGLDILVDPYSQSSAGIVRVVAFQDADIALRHAESFAAMKDALTT